MSAPRKIIIGLVLTPYYVHARNCGFPGGFLIFWRGKRDFGQPTDFLKWEDLLASLSHRLALAGLGLSAPPEKPKPYVTMPLTVMVQRLSRKLRKRAYEIQIQETPGGPVTQAATGQKAESNVAAP